MPAIPVDTPVHLMETTTNRGVTYEVSTNNDWVLLTNEPGRGAPVIFRRRDSGYTIQSTSAHWADYTYWQLTLNGIKLVKADAASVIRATDSTDGFMLGGPEGGYLYYPKYVKGWLKVTGGLANKNMYAFAHFRAEQ